MTHTPSTIPKPIHHDKTGLSWLLNKGKINPEQHKAGQRYGRDYRIVDISGMAAVKSCLGTAGMPHGGQNEFLGSFIAEAETEALRGLQAAREALHHETDMLRACDLICGRDMIHTEVIARYGGNQRDAEALVQSLRIALNILARHYRLTKS